MNTLIIIPTYNEAENIQSLISKINSTFDYKHHILVVDDSSPDGTAEIVEEIDNSKISLINRKNKNGLSSAYISGLRWGLKQDYDFFVQMDGDLSHPPRYLNSMIEAIQQDYDFVVGSRYKERGGVEKWDKIRELLSRCANLYARTILGMKLKDVTSGFNIWKRKTLEQMDLDQINSEGYSFQVEMKYRANKNGFSGCELPIIFKGREEGSSKMSKKIIFEAIWMIWWLRFNINKK